MVLRPTCPYVNEELVAEALGAVRNHVAIATKFGFKIEGMNGLDSPQSRRCGHCPTGGVSHVDDRRRTSFRHHAGETLKLPARSLRCCRYR
jgi:aryl-alcohol dehydrogenase-like predicted oxidoreductase